MAAKRTDVPELGLFEKADIPLVQVSTGLSLLFAALTGVFRGKASPRYYRHHVQAAAIRTFVDRISHRQQKSDTPASWSNRVRQLTRLSPEGYWLGNKDAKNVVVYYHGGGFSMAPMPLHFEFWLDLLAALNTSTNEHDIAATGALRYILASGRSPSNVIVGGDSAGGNLALATLLHLSHPHPEIEPIDLSEPLAGVFGFSPWISFRTDWPSFTENMYKDCVPVDVLKRWAEMYLEGREGDPWSEPLRAPAEWWRDAKTERVLIIAGSDEILLSPIRDIAEKIKSVFPNTTFIVGYDESHDAHLYVDAGRQTQTGKDLRQWIRSRL
ncbi:hypothetical protein N7470_009687 [Penicillium chermesinum]|nr:hypothetical protein N7470_009687 [Penicillium chermesinum]